MITFIEHLHTGYELRTRDNAVQTEATIYFYVDAKSPGFMLTRKCCYGKPFIPVDISEYTPMQTQEVNRIAEELMGLSHINIAGNSLPRLRSKYTQEGLNATVGAMLDKIHAVNPFTQVRTGGQGGSDLAGALWADSRGIPCTVLAPKNWMFRDEHGRDICNEQAFISRFGDKYDMSGII